MLLKILSERHHARGRARDADGKPDGWHELERDAEGTLVVERFTGSAANPEKARREYDDPCP